MAAPATWWERLDQLYTERAQQGALPYGEYGSVLDQAMAPWSTAQTPATAAQQSNSFGIWGDVQDWGGWGAVGDAGGAALNFGAPVFNVLAAPYRWLSQNVLSPATHILPVVTRAQWQKEIGASGSLDALFSGRSWDEIQRVAKKDSFGRGLVTTTAIIGDSITFLDDDPGRLNVFQKGGISDEDHDKFREGFYFKGLSGLSDFLSVMFLDPLYAGGKLIKATGVLRTTRNADQAIAKADGGIDEVLQQEPVTKWLAWTSHKSPAEIAKHPVLRNNEHAGMISNLLSKATALDKQLILKIALGDETALTQLQIQAPVIAAEYQRLKGNVVFLETKLLPTIPGLTDEAQAAILAPHKERAKKFGLYNSTMLTLNKTEFNPRDLAPFEYRQLPAEGNPPLGNWLLRDDQRLSDTFTTMYRPELADSRSLFTRSGEIERTPLHIRSAMDEFADFRDAALAAQRVLPEASTASRATPRPVSSSPWSASRIRGQQDLFGPHLTGEAQNARVTARGIRAQQAAGPAVGTGRATRVWAAQQADDLSATTGRVEDLMQSRRTMKAAKNSPASAPTSYQAWWHQQMVDPDTLFWTHNADRVEKVATSFRQQLDLINDWAIPELDNLDNLGAWATRLVDDAAAASARAADDAADAAITQADTGIFGSMTELPKGGLYRKAGETSAEARHAISNAYMRRLYSSKNTPQLVHSGWASRPAIALAHLGDALGRGMTPTTVKLGSPEAWKDVDKWLRRVRDLHPGARDSWVRQMMGATTEPEKLALLEKIEANVVRHMLQTHNIQDMTTIEKIVESTLGARKAHIGLLADAALANAGKTAPRGKAKGYTAVTTTPDGAAVVAGPQVLKQAANVHPLLDVNALEKAFKRDRGILQGLGVHAAADPIMGFLSGLNRFWKLSVLARPAYAIRTVSDEILLAAAATGSMMFMAGGVPGAVNIAVNVPRKMGNAGRRANNRYRVNQRKLPEKELKRKPIERGYRPVEVSPGIWSRGFADDGTGVTKALTAADQRDLFGLNDDMLAALRRDNNYGSLNPKDELDHLPAWLHALNHQIGSDRFARIFLRGGTVEDALKWMDTRAGIAYMRRMPLANAHREDWAQGVALMVSSYTKGDEKLMELALKGNVKLKDLRRFEVSDRPPVHGGQIDLSLNKGTVAGLFDSLANNFYKFASQVPTTTLVRHPVADLLYQRRLRELVAKAEAQGVRVAERPDRLYHFESIARSYTIKQMDVIFKDHLFSSPQTALRFVMPFFGAWRASIARWGRMVGEDPSIIARANQGWQGLHKPFDVVDEDGQPLEWKRLDEHGNEVSRWTLDSQGNRVENPAWAKAKPRNTDEEVFGFDTKNQIVMRLPKWAWKAVGATPLLPKGTEEVAGGRSIPLRSFNTVLQGDPWFNAGFGPFVTVPAAAAVRNSPYASELAEKAGILPFGPRSDWKDHVLPSYGKKAVDAADAESRSYNMTRLNIARVMAANILRGDMKPMSENDFAKEVTDRTDALMRLRLAESWLLPFSSRPLFYDKDWESEGVPKDLQFLAAKVRDYKQQFGNEAGEAVFLEEHPEAWLWLISTSKSKSKIPANFESWDKSEAVQRLAAAAPDVFDSAAGVGDLDYADFDAAVYDAQMNGTWNPVTGDKHREVRDPTTYVRDGQERMGWVKYSSLMDHIRNELEERDLVTVEQPGAKDLKELKSNYVKFLSDTNPMWGEAFLRIDPTKSQRIRDQAAVVATDERLLSDPTRRDELINLQKYLSARNGLVQELRRRDSQGGSADLSAVSNRALLREWDSYRTFLGSNTRFAELWLDRYFANDYLQEVR